MMAPYALIALLSLAAPLATTSPAAPQDKASTNKVSNDDECEVSLDSANLPELLQGSFESNAGEWVEYAPLKNGVPDTSAIMRLSIIADPETKKTGFELWFDKLGEFAVRSRVSPEGELIQELKQGTRAFLVPPAEKKGSGSPVVGKMPTTTPIFRNACTVMEDVMPAASNAPNLSRQAMAIR